MNKAKKIRKTIRKTIISIALAVIMALSGSTAVFADDVAPFTGAGSENKYLTFTAIEDNSSIIFSYVSGEDVMYSLDNGVTWNSYTKGTEMSLANVGDSISFKGNGVTTNGSNQFSMTGKIAASGDVTSLTNGIGGDCALSENCYSCMFSGCTSLTKAPALPATTLAPYCYNCMFSGCTGLTEAPALPATTLASSCYNCMFSGCTSLNKAPALPATTIAGSCYDCMFYGCTSLTQAPALPATTLEGSCYTFMFSGCISLKKAPALPATTLASSCYNCMFSGCTGLAEAPALSATTLASSCYNCMFSNCTSLAEAPAISATTLADSCCTSMFSGCTSLNKAPSLLATSLTDYCYSSMFSGCTSLTKAPALPATTLAPYCYASMFSDCTSLTETPTLSAEILTPYCYYKMFSGCTNLTDVPSLLATTLDNRCYAYMFKGCTGIKISEGKTESSFKEWKIPSDAISATRFNLGMFKNTGGTFTGDSEIGKTYYVCYKVDVEGVSLDKSAVTLIENETVQLNATVLPENADEKTVTWSSSNELIATVGEAGLVTAVSTGSATITATTVDGNKTAECIVTITHDMEHYEPVPATFTTTGTSEYWYCKTCKKYFSDSEGNNEIQKDSWILPVVGFNKTLELGMSGYDVKAVQEYLISHGYLDGEASGYFDDETYAAVTMFQAQNGLKDPDGCVGDRTINKIRNVSTDFESFKKGSYGTAVKAMQIRLVELGYLSATPDGDFGGMSETALKKFQLLNRLPITGVADAETLRKLYSSNVNSFRTMNTDMHGDDVLAIQEYLVDLGYLTATPDGIYGNYTKAAVTAFQAANGLYDVDGMCGNWTMATLASGNPVAFYEFKKGENSIAAKVMQKYLVNLGYLNVTPDGDFGNMSVAALKKFQLLNGLEITGEADQETLYKLYHVSALPFRTMNAGMYGDDVLAIQEYLVDLGYLTATPDGIYGNYTKAAVTAFQAANGLYDVDGQCGNWTMGVLASGESVPFAGFAKGDSSIAVKVMQKYLVDLGYLSATPDGDFGGMSETALMKFQLTNGLEVTGIADQETLYKLYHVDATRQRTLMVGSYGNDVKYVQQALTELKDSQGNAYLTATPDSDYGNMSKAAVRKFQMDHGLTESEADGMVGNWTLGEIVKELAEL